MGGVDKVEELMDEVEDVHTDKVEELLDLLEYLSEYLRTLPSKRMVHGIDADDDELLAELDRLLEEELGADSSKVDLGIAVDAREIGEAEVKKKMLEKVKQMGGVDKLEELMDEVEDVLTDAREIQEVMACDEPRGGRHRGGR
jgi:hypothetical protein